jgi:NTE family protein
VLVLSGGGARGAGHIGVLKALEELRVPVHGIVGTSMGAVVGGLYAAGYAPEDLERLIARVEWANLFVDDPDRDSFRFRRKREDASLLVRAASGVDSEGIKLPKGVLHGHRLKAFLTRHTLHVADIADFAQLAVPFATIATDISTGEAILLTGGNLADAMFASLTIPAFVGPVEIDGRLLVDGGVSNNLPVDVALTMNPEVIIAIDLSSPLRSKEALGSVLEVTDQITSILTRKNTEQQIAKLRDQDILIAPELGDVSSIDFERAVETITPSYRATLAQRVTLEEFAESPNTFAAHVAGLRREPTSVIEVADVQVLTDSRVDAQLLARRANLHRGSLSADEIESAVNELYGLELFSEVPYRYRDGTLTLSPVKRDWGPNYLQFGLALEDNFQGRNHYNLGVAYTVTELNAKAGEWRTELNIGERPKIQTEVYQPLGANGHWFFNPSVAVKAFNRGLFEDDNLIAEYQIRQAQLALAGGYTLGTQAELRLEFVVADGRRRRLIGDPALNTTSANSGLATLELRYDTLDNLYFPKRGRTFDARWTWADESLGSASDYRALEISGSQALGRGNHTMLLGAEISSVYKGTAPFHEQYSLGGFLNLSGLDVDQKLGQQRAIGRMVYYYRWLSSPVLPAYFGISTEAGQIWDDEDDASFASLDFAGSLFLGLDTPIGPIFLAGGVAECGNKSFYVFLGQPF